MSKVTNTVKGKLHPITGEDLRPTVVNVWRDGSTPMSDALCGGLYNKDSDPDSDTFGEYFRWNFSGDYPVSRLTTVNQANFQKLINDFGATPCKIQLDKSVNITANLTIPENVKIDWVPGSIFNISTGVTLTVNSKINEGGQLLFTGIGSVVLANPNVNAKWFALGNGTTDDSDALIRAISTANGGELFFPESIYIIGKPIPNTCSMTGQSVRRSIIKATSNFVGTYMLDNLLGQERQCFKYIKLDASDVSGLKHIGSSGDAEGASGCMYLGVYFSNSYKGTYSIGGASTTAVPGMVTGNVFVSCQWRGVGRVMNLGQNQDDVSFIGCRFGLDKCDDTVSDPFVLGGGSNHILSGCYIYAKSVGGSIKSIFKIGGNLARVQNLFIETVGDTNLTHIFRLSDPNCSVIIDGLHLNIEASAFRGLVRGQVEDANTDYRNLTINNVYKSTNFPETATLLELYVATTAAGKQLNFTFDHVDIFTSVYTIAANGATNTTAILKFKGTLRGVSYDTTASSTLMSSANASTRNNEVQTLSNKTLTSPVLNNPGSNGKKEAVSSRTASFTVQSVDCTELCDATSGAIVATLPLSNASASIFGNNQGAIYTFIKTDSGNLTVTVLPSGGELIDSFGLVTLRTQWDSVTIQSTGIGWVKLQESRSGRYTTVTGTTDYTITNFDSNIELGTPNASTRTITFPAGVFNKKFTIINKSVSRTNRWAFVSSVKFPDGSTNTNVPLNSAITITYDGANWVATSISIMGIRRTNVANVDYTVLLTDEVVVYGTLTAGKTVTLPDPATATFRKFTIKDEVGAAATSNITIVSAGTSITIDGASSKAINTNYGFLTVYSNGSSWFTI